MLHISWQGLPAGVAVAILLAAAASQAAFRRVPNFLTLPAIGAGWLYAAWVDVAHRSAVPTQALEASFLAALAALVIMLPLYSSGMLGAGCLKAQMAFGAWIGSAIPLVPAMALAAASTVGGLLFTFALCLMRAKELVAQGRRGGFEFPAQITISAVAVVGVIVCWAISSPA
jgi:Flp pilus assembly protein protease CpaA